MTTISSTSFVLQVYNLNLVHNLTGCNVTTTILTSTTSST